MSEPAIVERGEDRRVVALVLPDLLVELASARLVTKSLVAGPAGERRGRQRDVPREESRRPEAPPLGVLLVDEMPAEPTPASAEPPDAKATLFAVNAAAERFGVRVGQTVVEAHAFVARLLVKEVTRGELRGRLGEIAEMALSFGPIVSFEAPDTVWVDVTGAAHLAGGEEALALELAARVRELGHRVRVAMASGPRLAQAFARFGRLRREGCLIVAQKDAAAQIAALPVRALPIDAERAAWLLRLGVLTVGAIAALPRAAASARLGEAASVVLSLAEGRDDSPLEAYVPPALPREESTWDEPIDGIEPLLFALRGLVSRLSARLEGRGEAVQALDLVILHDGAVSRLRGVSRETSLRFELAAPIHRSEELFRVIASRLGHVELAAAAVGLRLSAKAITRALALQLELSRYASRLGGSAAKGPETLPVLLGELLSDLGKDKVGVLSLVGSHRPEKKSRLVKVTPELLAFEARRSSKAAEEPPVAAGELSEAPTRLLPAPIPLDMPLRRGATISLDHRLYSIERLVFERRLSGVEWWSDTPVSRDYVRVWLRSQSSVVEAIVYRERSTGVRMLQAVCD